MIVMCASKNKNNEKKIIGERTQPESQEIKWLVTRGSNAENKQEREGGKGGKNKITNATKINGPRDANATRKILKDGY